MQLDKTRRVTEIGGRLPLKYLQDGYGFDAGGNLLGRYDAQGEPVLTVEKVKEIGAALKSGGVIVEAEDDEHDSAGLGDLHEMTVLELRSLAKKRDIATTRLNKAALIEALEAE